MLARIEDDKETLKRQIEDQHPEWRETKPMPKPIDEVLRQMMEENLPIEDYPHDPWLIMRVQANRYTTASFELKRVGIESYSPTFRVLAPMPLRMVPPKKRHQASLYKHEVRRRRFDGYMFIRKLFGNHDLNRTFDLEGCGALVRTVGSIALVPDFDVELMRLAEANGLHDEVVIETYRGYKVTRLPDEQRWEGKSKIIGRLDVNGETILFVDRMGRIARLISQADPPA